MFTVCFCVWLLGGDHLGVRDRVAGLLHLCDLSEYLVQWALDRVEASLREVGEITFLGRTGDLQLGCLRAHFLESPSRLPDERILRVDLLPQRRGSVIGGPQVLAQRVEPEDVPVQRTSGVGDGVQQPRAAVANLLELRCPCGNTLLELTRSFLESRDFGRERHHPLHQPGIRGTRLGRPLAQPVNGLPGVIETALRLGQPHVGQTLRLGQPLD